MAAILAATLALGACDDDYTDGPQHVTGPGTVAGSGVLATEPRAVGGFNGIVLSGAGRLLISPTEIVYRLTVAQLNEIAVSGAAEIDAAAFPYFSAAAAPTGRGRVKICRAPDMSR